MKTLELARRRKTTRVFKKEEVNIQHVKQAIEVAKEAPSGANYQGWRYIIITNQQLKKQIRKASERGEKEFYSKVTGDWEKWLNESKINWKKPYLEEAPVLLMVYSKNSVPYSTESVWLAIGYLLLALEEQDLNTVTYTPSNTQYVEEAHPPQEGFRLEAILPIGQGKDPKPKEPREKIESLIKVIT
ncbi:nitroreductase family protein [Candidatus Bathyarchaeota archaeon]|nr:nitroreductase family protein [Candidatus Bathyarchaeota archaeon]